MSIVTSPLKPYPNCVREKFEWIAYHKGDRWTDNLMIAKDKTIVWGDKLIDDRPDPRGEFPPT